MKRKTLICLSIISIILCIGLFCLMPAIMRADDITGQTWYLDSTGSKATTWTDIVWLIWTAVSSDDHDLAIHDASGGDLILQLKAKAGVDMIVPFPGNSGHLPGIYITTLDSGYVLMRLGKNR